MARKPRIEIEGGLYHVITRGNDRRDIFHCAEDYERFLALLTVQKGRLPFYFYAYCLMTNHIHLLIERRADDIGRIMHRVLTGYGQYYNRKYRKVGHVLQGRYKAIVCQSEPYLAELVRYIHLNPVRANMVELPEDYPYSSHRAYLGLGPAGAIDVEPVLRHFGPKKAVARDRFAKHVAAGIGLGHQEALYDTTGGVLGTAEFVDAMIHRVGEFVPKGTPKPAENVEFDAEALIAAVESVCGVSRADFCGKGKGSRVIAAKETLILTGRRLGATVSTLAKLTSLDSATISRRHDSAIRKMQTDEIMITATAQVIDQYESRANQESSISQA